MKASEKLRSGEKNLKPSKSFNGEREREGIKFIFYGILEWVNECEVVLGRMIHAGNCDRRFFNNAYDDKS